MERLNEASIGSVRVILVAWNKGLAYEMLYRGPLKVQARTSEGIAATKKPDV
jgi:hypothetical protein